MSSSLPIVFIPGASSDEAAWEPQRAYFAAKAHVVVVNLTAYDDIGAMSDYVLKQVPGDFMLAGTSMGGYVALDVLKKAQSRVKRVALCNTSARADTPQRQQERQAEINLGPDAYVQARKDDTHYFPLISKKSSQDKKLIEKLREISERVGYGCFSRHQTACANRAESLSFLPQITIPALITSGDEDQLIPPALQQEMHSRIKGAKLVTIEQAGHIAQLEQPDAMTAALDNFFFAS